MKIHFIGLGGIGVSALAQYYLAKGHQISGSDLVSSEITDFFVKKGVKVMIDNRALNISRDIDLVIHTPAVKPDNPEYCEAKALGIKTQSYPEALGELTKEYETIAVSGAHGKSTTTAMIGLLLTKAGIDPTIIVGTKLKELGNTNFRMGASKYLVIEACEYDGSFLHYTPKITVITNIDKEHMDYFKTFTNVLKTFKQFILQLPLEGFLVINKDDPYIKKIHIVKPQFKTVVFSARQKEAVRLKKILKIPGKHNVSNALAALTVARILGVKDSVSFKSLSEYRGSWRRFELFNKKIGKKKITLISDYGHHPNEVLATLTATREKFPKKKIWCIFQPHQHQRTYYLFNDFVKLFRKVKIDQIIIIDIYDVAGREVKKINMEVSSELLVKKIARKNIHYLSVDSAEALVIKEVKNGEVVIIMGAGDIYKLVDRF